VNLDLSWQPQLGETAQVLAEDLCLDPQLFAVTCVLVVAATARAEVRTGRRYAFGGRPDDGIEPAARETGALLGEGGCDLFALEHEWDERGFAFSGSVGGQASQTVAAIYELFDG
jgi:hypothetical protein